MVHHISLERQNNVRSPRRRRRVGRTTDMVLTKGIQRILAFEEPEPFEVLGPHPVNGGLIVRAFLPRAAEAWILPKTGTTKRCPMKKLHSHGLFEGTFKQGRTRTKQAYRIEYVEFDGTQQIVEDPYAFGTEISDFDLQLFGEGTHHRIYEKLGAHGKTIHGVLGTHFAVWAPNAKGVSVVGDFNHWRAGAHPMSRIRFSGVWGLFIPGLKAGDLYKFAVRGSDHAIRLKTDPYAAETELRPLTASRVGISDRFKWSDGAWIEKRKKQDVLATPISIYEVHLGSWKRKQVGDQWHVLSYRELAQDLIGYVKTMGFTHIELLPIMEHPLDESWGYQVINFFAPTSRYGKPEDFMFFVDECHKNGIGVILDWVPGHFPTDAHGISNFDGREIYAYESWRKREHKEWGTFVFDYGKNEVRNFLLSNALYWLERYHVDGLRVDAVASMLYLDYARRPGEWEPNLYGGNENLEFVQFVKKLNETVYSQFPGILMIAEESTAWPGVSRPTYLGGLGFGMKWNMGWMHDTLHFFSRDPVYRKYHQGTLTFSLLYAFSENFILPVSHDEVVHGKQSLLEKMPGDDWQKFANLRLFTGFMFAHPGKKLLFMGCEFGQRKEWNCVESLDWHLLGYERHEQVQKWVTKLNHFYKNEPSLYSIDFNFSGFEWIDFSDIDLNVISFVRRSHAQEEFLVIVCNMTPVVRENYRIGVPKEGVYQEVLNSDAKEFGGSGILNSGQLKAEPTAWQGKPYSTRLTLAPLSIMILKKSFRPKGKKVSP